MTADAHSLIAAHALDALDPTDQDLAAGHLDECEYCAEDLARLTRATQHLATVVAESPPPRLRADVLAAIAVTPQFRPLPPHPGAAGRRRATPAGLAARDTVAPAPAPASDRDPASDPDPAPGAVRPRRSPLARLLGAAAAAALVACAALSAVVADQRADLSAAREQAADAQTLASSALTVARSEPVAGGGEITMANAGNLAVVSARGLPPLEAGRVYQLWLVGPRGARSAGLTDGRAGAADWVVGNVGDAEKVALTVEPAGGSPQPTTDPVGAVELKAQSGERKQR